MINPPLLHLEHLTLERNGQILFQLPLCQILQGEWAYLFGPHGSGKSSLFSLLLGALKPPPSSQIQVLGQDLKTLNPKQLKQLRRQIGWVSPQWTWLKNSSVRQNWDFLLQASDWALPAQRSLRISHLAELLPQSKLWLDRPFEQLSKPQAVYALFGRALLNQPRLILVDETETALQEQDRRNFHDFVQHYAWEHKISLIWAGIAPPLSLLSFQTRSQIQAPPLQWLIGQLSPNPSPFQTKA